MENWQTLLPSEPDWLASRTILFARTGSHAYGTATEESDQDFKGIVIPPAAYFLGLESFEGYDKSGGKSHKNTASDIDVTLVHINKFVHDALKGVPNNLELLFLASEDYLHLTSEGLELLSMRQYMLSKRTFHKFGGYAHAQMQKLINHKGDAARIEQYGYDTKIYMHAVRLYEAAIEILRDGYLTVRSPNAAELLAIRSGKYDFLYAMQHLVELENELKIAHAASVLPDEPDVQRVNEWLIQLNRECL